MKINIFVNFEKDFKNIVLRSISHYFNIDFNNKKYTYMKDLSAYKVYFKFLSESKRVPYPTPRNVHISKELLNSEYYEQYKHKIEEIKKLFEAGKSAKPYLHDDIKNLFKINSEKDCLLNDWDIHHLHLGEIRDNAIFCSKTKELLFCKITDTDVYFLQILPHKQGFCDKNLLRILKDNWLEAFNFIELSEISSIGGKKLTDIEYRLIREGGMVTPIELDGKYYFSPNLGVASSRDSSKDVRLAMDKINLLNELQDIILRHSKVIYDFIIRCNPRQKKPQKIYLKLIHFEDELLIAKDIFSNAYIEIKINNNYVESIQLTQGQNKGVIQYETPKK